MRDSWVFKFVKKHKDVQWMTYLIDGLCLSLLILAYFHNQFSFDAEGTKEYGIPTHASSLVTVLLPTVITVVSIALSLSVELTYELTIKGLNAILTPYCFTPLHISLVMSSCFLLYVMLSLLNNGLGIFSSLGSSLSYTRFTPSSKG